MPKKMLIDATHAEETRVVVVDGNRVDEFDFESENKRQLAGNIYLAKVTRVEPSLQAAFIDYGGNRHGFLAFSEIHPDYYQIPVADRQALLAEEREFARQQEEEEEKKSQPKSRSRGRSRSKAENTVSDDAVTSRSAGISGMEVTDLDDGADADPIEGLSPAFTVDDTPVATPAADDAENDQPETDAPELASDDGASSAEQSDSDGDHSDDDSSDDSDDIDRSERDGIESIAEEDVSEEIRQPRKARAKKYRIQEVIKVRQILLIQVVKEERGNKGAALTTYLSLAGRYCVLMPNTARGGGISRKITNAVDRKKLKEIANEIEVPDGAGLIIRTAGSQRTKTEIKRDYEYLQRLWEQIRELTLKSIAPAKIYEEGNLIKRSIRDLYNKDIDEVFVEGEAGYRVAKDFMKMIMPSHAKNVKLYTDPMPLFARHQVESYLSGMFNPTVQLKSGGYIVIGVTEALVAIDVNSGRATKEGSIEDTATKTNLEAAEEVARQLRLRDLAGLIVIDFIDMEERRNNSAVEKRFKDKLKTDRARIQVGRISGFGLMEMSRQRLRPGMIEATTQPCNHCHGTGLIRSDDNLALNILRQLEEEGVRRRSREVLLKAPIAIANYLMNNKREHILQIETRYGMSVRVEADPFLISPDFAIEKFKTATRIVPEVSAHVVSVNAALMADIDDEDADIVEEADEDEEVAVVAVSEDAPPTKKKRRRRSRRRKGGQNGDGQNADGQNRDAQNGDGQNGDAQNSDTPSGPAQNSGETTQELNTVAGGSDEAPAGALADAVDVSGEAPRKVTRSRSRRKPAGVAPEVAADGVSVTETEITAAPQPAAVGADEPAAKPARKSRAKQKAAVESVNAESVAVNAVAAEIAGDETSPAKPPRKRATRSKAKPAADAAVETTSDVAASGSDATPAVAKKPRRAATKKKVEDAAPIAAQAAPAAPIAATVSANEVAVAPALAAAPTVAEAKKPDEPKKKGWWSQTR